MNSRHLVDPTLEHFLDAPAMELTAENLAATRQAFLEMFPALFGAADPDVRVDEYIIPGPPGAPNLRAYVFSPPGPKILRPGFFHIHGGGFVLGDVAMMTPISQLRAKSLDCVVVGIDYRLAPETPYPGPIEDCYAGLKWMVDNAEDLGVDVERIVVGGESAGGGLSAALCLMARDRGGPSIAYQFLIYPMLDDRTGTPADPYCNPFAGEFGWTRSSNRFGWSAMLGSIDPAGQVPSYCSPSRATSLVGLPPTFIGVGALDLFVDENIDYAARLIREGVAVELHVYPGAFHGFDNAVADAPLSVEFKATCLRALAQAFKKSRSGTQHQG